MLKTELLELLSSVEDTADINETIQGIEGLTKTFDLKSIGLDDFKNVLETNDIAKTYYQSSLDSGVGKGVAKYKENFNKNELPKLVEEAIKAKSLEGLTEDQIRYKNLEAEVLQMKTEKARSEMSSKYTKTLAEKGLDVGLIDFVLGQDDTTTETNIEKLSGILSNLTENKVKEKLNNSSYVPPKNDSKTFGKPQWDDVVNGTITYEQYKESTLKAN